MVEKPAEMEDERNPYPEKGKVGPFGMVVDKPVEDEGSDISHYVQDWQGTVEEDKFYDVSEGSD